MQALSPETGTYAAGLEHAEVTRKRDATVAALTAGVDAEGVVGVVIHANIYAT